MNHLTPYNLLSLAAVAACIAIGALARAAVNLAGTTRSQSV